ncbi:GGDEF domain-containing protein [Rhizobium sp. TH2]|uniref:GGDEF domain-containing protein n=1 Tax=Rhizobium sp. TH2 TaxID=2775403 RepID=UPI002157B786|nr:GGDEF domain-containing protein [Rhizobium sp. TH2]UVC10971.1 GGDEF domain-containing protein [Rhizobium sp. TH2]
MQLHNVIVLALEAVVYFLVLITLLHWRHRIGIGVFITVLATMHFLETYLAATFYVQVPMATISPGSAVFFAGKLLMVLLLYVKEDAPTVRQLIYGLLIGNLLSFVLGQILTLHGGALTPGGMPSDEPFLRDLGILMIWGTSLLYLDSIGIILIYERLGSIIGRRMLPRFFVAGMLTLAFDQIGFYGVLHLLTGAPASVFWGGLVAKMAMNLLFVALTGIYLSLFKSDGAASPVKGISDVFNDLTYRERYQDLLARTGKDGLTGVHDRGRLEFEGPEIIREAVRNGREISIMVVDADHFKEVNDKYGHLEGDEVLKRLAGILTGAVRKNDMVYRFGGEEFVILAQDMGHRLAVDTAERIRSEIEKNVKAAAERTVTVSIGVSAAPQDGGSLLELISAADRRLYRAKAEGRNRIIGA